MKDLSKKADVQLNCICWKMEGKQPCWSVCKSALSEYPDPSVSCKLFKALIFQSLPVREDLKISLLVCSVLSSNLVAGRSEGSTKTSSWAAAEAMQDVYGSRQPGT